MQFDKKSLRALLIPLVIEQVLTGLMGVADTLMVSSVGEAAISGVSLVDAVNLLVVYFLSALAAGGTIVCSQYIGHEDPANAGKAAHQVMITAAGISLVLTLILGALRRPLLRLIFGSVEPAVMEAAVVYMLITVLSYPFLAMYTTGAAAFRAAGDSRRPMIVAAAADVLNIIGNAVLIFGFGMGVAGAALSTLVSRILSAAVMLWFQARTTHPIALRGSRDMRPDGRMIRRILRIGLPSAVENGMFQLGRLAVQSTVSILGTTAIAAQALALTLETFGSMPAQAIGTGLLTVAGQCIGRGQPDEARRYMRRFTRISTGMVLATGILISASVAPAVRLTALSADGAALTCRIIWVTSAVKLILWPAAFTLPNGLRAAGDVSFTMWVSTLSMWIFRVGLSWTLCRFTSVGLWGVWIGWCTDWLVRNICFRLRARGGRWLAHSVL